MHLPISPRLIACCEYISQGMRVADIGCDHGYLGIHLLQNEIASFVIASDINEGPLQSAVNNAKKYAVSDKIAFYLSDGARNIPHDFDALVCAGMGADTIVSILDHASWLKNKKYRLILQCQSKTPYLRQYLSDNGYHIEKEKVLRDGRFLYTVMAVVYDPLAPRLKQSEYYLSPALLKNLTPELTEYYERLIFSLRRAINGRGENADAQMIAALEGLEALKSYIYKEEGQ